MKKYSPDATVCIAFNSYFWLVDFNDFINIILSKLIDISSISGLLPPGTQFDLFRGTAAMKQDVDDMYATNLGHTIKVSCRCLSSWHYFCIYESDLNLTLENTYTWTCVVCDFFFIDKSNLENEYIPAIFLKYWNPKTMAFNSHFQKKNLGLRRMYLCCLSVDIWNAQTCFISPPSFLFHREGSVRS